MPRTLAQDVRGFLGLMDWGQFAKIAPYMTGQASFGRHPLLAGAYGPIREQLASDIGQSMKEYGRSAMQTPLGRAALAVAESPLRPFETTVGEVAERALDFFTPYGTLADIRTATDPDEPIGGKLGAYLGMAGDFIPGGDLAYRGVQGIGKRFAQPIAERLGRNVTNAVVEVGSAELIRRLAEGTRKGMRDAKPGVGPLYDYLLQDQLNELLAEPFPQSPANPMMASAVPREAINPNIMQLSALGGL